MQKALGQDQKRKIPSGMARMAISADPTQVNECFTPKQCMYALTNFNHMTEHSDNGCNVIMYVHYIIDG